MKEDTRLWMVRAGEAIDAAGVLVEKGFLADAISRAYYAIFYIAEALLNEKGLHFSKHGGVHGAFGEHYVKSGIFAAKYHKWLLKAFSRRIAGDYDPSIRFKSDEAREMIQQAGEFLQAAKKYLGE
ncbi:MAG: HEPN domain-containing protein [Anaerolineales bacterium]|nr:HEPN domain-containing protein [Anaerolineales bacterium]